MENVLVSEFANLLKSWLSKNQITQMEISHKTGIPQPMISRILSGKRNNLTLQTIQKISTAFGKIPKIKFENLAVAKTKVTAVPPRSAACFWDVDIASVHLPEYSYFVAERILNFGARKEIRWLLRNVSADTIKEVITTSRNLSPKSRSFWSLCFNVKFKYV